MTSTPDTAEADRALLRSTVEAQALASDPTASWVAESLRAQGER